MAKIRASIDFGLVHIPVELVNAEDRADQVSFHMLDSRDNSRIRFKRVNENTGKEVEWEDIVKGYEVDQDQYVIFTDDELKELEAESNKSLSIDAFVSKEEIAPSMFESPYYLVPGDGGEKGYAILEKVLEKTERYAVVQAVLRNKEQLGVIYAHEGMLMLDLVRYPHELKKPSDVMPSSLNRVKVSAKEVAMAERLMEEMSGKFKPSAYKDDYFNKVQQAIKIKTKTRKAYKATKSGAKKVKKTVDIVDLLAKSLKQEPRKSSKRAA